MSKVIIAGGDVGRRQAVPAVPFAIDRAAGTPPARRARFGSLGGGLPAAGSQSRARVRR
jgi:hypothetical protein